MKKEHGSKFSLVRAKLLDHPVLFVGGVALLVRVMSIIFIHYIVGTETFGVGDDQTYSFMAEQVAEGRANTWGDYTRQLYNSTATFSVPLTLLYLVFGSVELAGPLLAASFGALAAAATTRLALECLPSRWAMVAGGIVALVPSQVLWSSLTLKDSAVWAVLAGSAAAVAVVARSADKRFAWGAATVVILFVLIAHLRPHTLVVVCWALMAAAFFWRSQGRHLRIASMWLIGISVPLLLGLGPAGFSLARGQDLEYRRTANAFGAATSFIPEEDTNEDEAAAAATEVAQVDEQLMGALRQIRDVSASLEDLAFVADRAEALRKDLVEASQSGDEVRAAQVVAEVDGLLRVTQRAAAGRDPELREKERLDRAVEAARAAAEQRAAVAARLGSITGEQEVAQDEDAAPLSPTLRHLPRGLSVMLLEPYPWQATDNRRVQMAKLEWILWFPLLVLAFIGFVQAARDPARRAIYAYPVLVGAGVVLLYALVEGNFGTAFRHRGEFVWVVALLAATGGEAISRRWRAKAVSS